MGRLLELERQEDRVLCALRCVEATTGAPIDAPLLLSSLQAPHPRIIRNRSGLMVIADWSPLEGHTSRFASPPAAPPTESMPLSLQVVDPSERFLPRLATVRLPRPSDPSLADHLLLPIDLPLYPSSSATLSGNWAVLRVSVISQTDEALGGALLRVLRDGVGIGMGLSDWRGEALVAVAGVPITSFSEGEGAQLTSDLAVVLEAVFNPSLGSRTPLQQVRDGPPPDRLPLVDPDRLEGERAQLPNQQLPLRIAARRQTSATLRIPLP